MGSFRTEEGQASVEHVGLIALIAVVIASAAGGVAALSPGVRERVSSAFMQALCVVSGQGCDAFAREPCPTLRTVKTTAQGLAVAFVRLGHDRMLSIERRSDGTYVMTQTEGTKGGLAAAQGLTGSAASLGVEGSFMLGRRAGRTYEAATPQEARALVERLRRERAPGVQAVVRGAADLAGLARTEPSVSSYVLAGEGAANALAQFGLGGVVEGGIDATNQEQLGVRIAAHEREITAFASLDARARVFFDALQELTVPVGRGSRGGGSEAPAGEGKAAAGGPGAAAAEPGAGGQPERRTSVIENPLAIGLEGAAVVGGTVALRFGPGPTLLGVEVIGYAGTGATQREVRARLDPSDPVVRAALDAWRRAPGSVSALAGLGRAARDRAAVDVRTFSTTRSDHMRGAQAALAGLAVGGEFGSEGLVSALVEQRSRPVGGVWEERTDCVANRA